MPPFSEMDAVANGVVAVFGIVSILSPVILQFFGKLQILQFGHPKVFKTFGGLGGLAAFLAVFGHRGFLSFAPAAPVWIVCALVLGFLAFYLANESEVFGPGRVILGLFLFVLANALMMFGITKLVAEQTILYRLEGIVTSQSEPVEGVVVTLEGRNRTFRDSVNEEGEFHYLLYKPEAEDVFRIRPNAQDWRFIVWQPSEERVHSIQLSLDETISEDGKS